MSSRSYSYRQELIQTSSVGNTFFQRNIGTRNIGTDTVSRTGCSVENNIYQILRQFRTPSGCWRNRVKQEPVLVFMDIYSIFNKNNNMRLLRDKELLVPNAETCAAIEECESGIDLETLDIANFKDYVKSL